MLPDRTSFVPDLRSNRYAEISVSSARGLRKYDLPYSTGPLLRQYRQSFWTSLKLAVPDSWLPGSTDGAPEINSDKKFREVEPARSRANVTDSAAR